VNPQFFDIWVERFHDAPRVHSSVRIHCVMGAHKGSSLLCVRHFGGVSLSRLFFFFAGLVSFALRLPSDSPSRFRPCLRLVLVSRSLTLTGFRYRGLSPHKFTPVPGVHKSNTADRYAPADFFVCALKINLSNNPINVYDIADIYT